MKPQICTAQKKEEVLIEISNKDTNKSKLDYLGDIINEQWYSGSNELTRYVRMYDSIAVLNGTDKYLGIANNFKGMSHYASEEFDIAINYYLKAIELLEKEKESNVLAQVYNNLAGCYKVRNDFENTEKYFIKALTIYTKLELTGWIANLHNNLAVLYMENEFYDKADIMFDLAIDSYKQSNNTTMMGITYMNQGNSRIFSGDDYDAMDKYLNAMKLIDKKQIPLVHAVSETGIGIALTHLKEYSRAFSHLNKGLNVAKRINHIEQTMESYNALADYYAQTNNYEDAYKLSIQSQGLKDSVLNVQQDQHMAEALIKYETEKKDKEIATQQLQLKEKEADILKRKSEFRLALFGSLLFLISSIGIWLFYRQRQKLKNKEIETLKTQRELNRLEALINGEEKERTRIAQDLHDGINGDLSAIKYKITSIENKKFTQNEQDEFNSVISMLDNTIEQVRHVSHNLAPPSLQKFNLIEAIEQYCSKINNTSSIKINFQNYGDLRSFKKEKETVIYRIIQEAISNIVKHSKATEALIQINNHEDYIHITIEDNGIGYDIKNESEGLGIKNIRSRVEFLNGEYVVDSSKKGTSIHIDISLKSLIYD